MREIKFRAWDNEAKLMRHAFFIASTTGKCHSVTPALQEESLELMQFTGLQDKHGKEIYEGDILLYRWPSGKGQNIYSAHIGYVSIDIDDYGETFEYTGVYFLEKDSGKSISGYWHPPLDQLEIIGNIYEHPELVERK